MRIAPRYIQKKLLEYDKNLSLEWKRERWMVCENGNERFEYRHKDGTRVIEPVFDELIEIIKQGDMKAGLYQARKEMKKRKLANTARVNARNEKIKEDKNEFVQDVIDVTLKNQG